MTARGRAVTGVLLGGLVALLAHPASRPFLLLGVSPRLGPDPLALTPDLPENLTRLPAPRDLETAALWVQVGAQRELEGPRLTVDDALLLAETANDAARSDPENGFWHHAEVVFLRTALAGQRPDAAMTAWQQAAGSTRWTAHETARLRRVLDGLDGQAGVPFAWHRAAVMQRRSDALCLRLQSVAKSSLGRKPVPPLKERLWFFRSGILIRDGARSVRSAWVGANLVDASVGLPAPNALLTPRALEAARGRFYADLQAAGMGEEAAFAATESANNEAWKALVRPERAEADTEWNAAASVWSAGLPAGMLVAGLLGLVPLALSWIVRSLPVLGKVLAVPWGPALGVVAGLAAYRASELAGVGLWVCLAVASFAVAPDRSRPYVGGGFGQAFALVNAILGGLAALALAASWTTSSRAGRTIGTMEPFVGPFEPGSPALVWLALLLFSISCATAAGWAYSNRHTGWEALPEALRRFGVSQAVFGLGAAVVVTPLAIWADALVADRLEALFLNAPHVYMVP